MPRSYVPVLLGVEAAGDLPGAVWRWRARRCSIARLSLRRWRRSGAPSCCASRWPALLPIAVTVIDTAGDVQRHPAFRLRAAAARGRRRARRRCIAAARWLASAALALAVMTALLFSPASRCRSIGMVRLHPYEYVYFNASPAACATAQIALHARLLGPRLQTGGRGAARRSSPARREPARPDANGRSRCAARIRRPRSRSATTSSRPGTRRAPTSRCRSARSTAPSSTRRCWWRSCAMASSSPAAYDLRGRAVPSLFTDAAGATRRAAGAGSTRTRLPSEMANWPGHAKADRRTILQQ